jgi:hypothetical protein
MAAEKTANTVHEMTAHFQLAFNNTYLWIAAEQMGNATIDTDHTAIPNSWERDDFEVFITMDTTSWIYGGRYGEANNQFRMQRDAEYPWGFDDAHSIGANNANFLIGQVDAGDGSFVQEWQIPWSGLRAPMVDSGSFDGRYLKFEIQAADNTTGSTGGRNDQRFWRNNSDNEYQDSRTLCLIRIELFIPCYKSARIDEHGFLWQPNCDPPFPPGIKSKNLSENAIIFPNPATEYFRIPNDGTLKLIIIRNIFGEEITRIAVKNEKNINVPITNFTSGLYLVTLTNISGMSFVSKVIKQ